MAKIDLDNPKVYQQYDTEGMITRIKEMPTQCHQAWQDAMSFSLPDHYVNVDKVVILGMGGSAIGGDLVRTLVEAESRIPVLIHRGYGLPAFVDARTLVIASSYSGNTEETLSAFEPALPVSTKKLVMTTGGKLKEMAEANHVPVFLIKYQAQPRAALGYSFIPTLSILQKLGFIRDKSNDLEEAVQALKGLVARIDEQMPSSHNPAKQLAKFLYGRSTVIYGAGIAAEVAHRWKTQINENSKAWAFYEIFPELNHNAVVGFELPKEVASRIRVVLLRTPSFNQRLQLRYEVTCKLLDRAKVKYEFVDSIGNSLLSQMLSLVSFGDFVSYYLAILYRIDPSPVEVINYLKDRLAKG